MRGRTGEGTSGVVHAAQWYAVLCALVVAVTLACGSPAHHATRAAPPNRVPIALAAAPPAPPAAAPPALPIVLVAEPELDPARLERIDDAVRVAIAGGEAKGAVVVVVHAGKIALQKAYGARATSPSVASMTADTVFDLASLTKPIVTATSIAILAERGELHLSDRVAIHLPEFGREGKESITIEHLLLHTAGLTADNPLRDYDAGPREAFEKICALPLEADPGARFLYSDIGYIILGALVERVSGERLDAFAQKNIFGPLGMRDTGFTPGEAIRLRAAPTEARAGRYTPGEVHDPRAFRLGGAAGHAGLFSTAGDLAIFAQMILREGEHDGARILQPASVRLFSSPHSVPGAKGATWLRALGWDVQTNMSGSRGSLFPAGSFGHTGFTGTSMWIDPSSNTAVILLTSRLYPDGKGSVSRLRADVATIVASAIVSPRPTPSPLSSPDPAQAVLTGIDVLKRDSFRALQGSRVGLITNHTGEGSDGTSTIDLLHKAEGFTLVALFSPEHGLRGDDDAAVKDGRDAKTGLPVYSLYGPRKRPTAAELAGIDTLVFDIQDIGCRFYTYLTTLGYVLEAAAQHKRRVIVLDRPNPIGGLAVEGPMLDPGSESFVGYHPLPLRHGMTMGELAWLLNRERRIGADLHIIRAEGWRRGDLFDATGLRWINPSPNIRNLTAALLYPGVGLLETTNLSVGRGTDRPFHVVGAPFIDGLKLAEALTASAPPGVRFSPARFTPSSSTHAGRPCGGVEIIVEDRDRIEPVRVGLHIAQTLRLLYPGAWRAEAYATLLANRLALEALLRGAPLDAIMAAYSPGLSAFAPVRERYLIYPEQRGVAK
jgi:uncharacterized protein YbbC (DUF1343 family)/CubicO group peptidase (beta-lactamase class C family)